MEIQLLSSHHLAEVKEISDAQFGYNYLKYSYLESFLSNKNLGLVCVIDHKVVGMSLVKIASRDEIAAELLVGEGFVKEKFHSNTTLALRKHLAVKKGFESKRIGSLMVEKGMQELEQRLVDAILSIVWKEGSSAALDKILTDFGSNPIVTFENYWAEDSVLNNYTCPACCSIPCKCSAILYVKLNKP
jgi:ribosomal protein S18 acetylase RimI-like enzyme